MSAQHEWDLPHVLVCASGKPHRDFGLADVSIGVDRQAALDAAEFMDDRDPADSPWQCGPHTFRRLYDEHLSRCPYCRSLGHSDDRCPAAAASTPKETA